VWTLQPHTPWFAGTVLWGTWRTTTDLGSFVLTHMWNYVRTMELVVYKHSLQEVIASLEAASFQWFAKYLLCMVPFIPCCLFGTCWDLTWWKNRSNLKLLLFSQWHLSTKFTSTIRKSGGKPVLSSDYNSWSTHCISSHTITAVSHHITDLFILGTIIVGVGSVCYIIFSIYTNAWYLFMILN